MNLLRGLNSRWTSGAVIAAIAVIAMFMVFETGKANGHGKGYVGSDTTPLISSVLPLQELQKANLGSPEAELTLLAQAQVTDPHLPAGAHDASQVKLVSHEQSNALETSSISEPKLQSALTRQGVPNGHRGLPEGKWTRKSAMGIVVFEIKEDRIHVKFEGVGEYAELNLSLRGEYSTASDGTIFGLIHSVDVDLTSESIVKNQELAILSMLSDLPFAMRVHSEPEAMTLKKLTVGIPMILEGGDSLAELGAYSIYLCGRYASDDK